MAFDFPNSPTVGQKYPASPIGGQPTYTWDGEKWTTVGGAVTGKTAVWTDGSSAMTAQLTLVAPPVNPTDAAAKSYVDALKTYVDSGLANDLKVAGGQTTTGGFRFTGYNAGTIASGSYTPDAYNGNYHYYTNNGPHTLAAPANDCAIDILVTNGVAAGVITFSGFTVGANPGDALTQTNNNRFVISIRRINGVSTYLVKALQ
jgi:hypothetical protein